MNEPFNPSIQKALSVTSSAADLRKTCIRGRPPHDIMEGSFVVLDKRYRRFYGIVVDPSLRAIDERFAREPDRACRHV